MDGWRGKGVEGWREGRRDELGRKNIWDSGLFPLETTILFLQRISTDSPKICGYISWAHQIPCSGFQTYWTKPQWLTTTGQRTWVAEDSHFPVSLVPNKPSDTSIVLMGQHRKSNRSSVQQRHKRSSPHHVGPSWSISQWWGGTRKLSLEWKRAQPLSIRWPEIHSSLHVIFAAYLTKCRHRFGEWDVIMSQKKKILSLVELTV